MFGCFSSLAVTGPDRFQLIADNGYWARFAVLPGDRVDIYYSEANDNNRTVTELLFEDVRVLAINTVYTENPEAPTIEGANATIELAPSDAEQFINTRSSRGEMSLALRSVFTPTETDAKPRQDKGVRVIRYGRS